MNNLKLQEHPLILSVLLNTVFFFLFLSLGEWKYDSLDDLVMSSVLTGAYGGQLDSHLYFVNGILGFALTLFYWLFPSVGWYSIAEAAEVFVSFVAMTYSILVLMSGRERIVIASIFVCLMQPLFWPNLGFTQCAAVLCAAGISLANLSLLRNQKTWMIVATLFFLAAFVMRKDMLLLGMPAFALSYGYCCYKRKSIFKKQLVILLIGFGLAWGLQSFDTSLYKQNEYSYYAAYQGPRAFFGDGAFYDSESAYDEFKERGMVGADLRALKSWFFYDKSAFQLDSLYQKRIVANRNRYDLNYLKLPVVMELAISRAFMEPNTWCWLLLCLILVFNGRKESRYVPWVSLGLVVLSYAYMLMVNRVVGRVESGAWLYATVFIIPAVCEQNIPRIKKNGVLFVVSVIIVAFSISTRVWNSFTRDENPGLFKAKVQEAKWLDFEKYVSSHPDDVFILSFERYKEFLTGYVRPHQAVKPGSWNNIFSFGYWNINLPSMERELQQRGVNNPIVDVDHANVFVLEDAEPLLPYYIKEHYQRNLVADTIKVFDDLVLVKYRYEVDDESN